MFGLNPCVEILTYTLPDSEQEECAPASRAGGSCGRIHQGLGGLSPTHVDGSTIRSWNGLPAAKFPVSVRIENISVHRHHPHPVSPHAGAIITGEEKPQAVVIIVIPSRN